MKKRGFTSAWDDLQLLLTRVTRDVEHVGLVIDNVRTLAEELVDDAPDRHLVAGDGGSGDDDLVLRADVDLFVRGEGHAVQRAHLLALAAGRDDDLLLRRETLERLTSMTVPFGSFI